MDGPEAKTDETGEKQKEKTKNKNRRPSSELEVIVDYRYGKASLPVSPTTALFASKSGQLSRMIPPAPTTTHQLMQTECTKKYTMAEGRNRRQNQTFS